MSQLWIEAALRSLLVALVVWAGMQAFRMRNVLAEKAAWSGVLAAAILMPLLLPMAARWQVLPATAGIVLPANPMTLLEELRATLESRRAAANKPSRTLAPAAPVDSPEIEESTAPSPDRASGDGAPAPADSSIESAPLLATIQPQPVAHRFDVTPTALGLRFYLVVVLALLCRIFYGLWSALRLYHAATPITIPEGSHLAAGLILRSSCAVASPVTIGSAVVLPADYTTWGAEKLRVVLAHERSHIRQGDFYLQFLAGFYAAVFWFSPLGWWLKRKLSDLAEAISDRAALGEATSRSGYAQILLEFAAAPRPTLIGVAMARSGRLSQRIERLLNDNSFRQAFAGTRRRALLAVLLVPVAIFAATALVRVQAAGRAQQKPAPASQASPAASPEAPVTGQAHPDQAPDAAPWSSDQEQAPLPPAAPNAAPTPPPNAGIAVIPPGADLAAPIAPVPVGGPDESVPPISVHVPGIDVHQPAVNVHVPAIDIHAPAVNVHVPSMDIHVPSLEGRAYFVARAGQNPASGYSYRYSSNGDSYAVITGDERQHMPFSGDIHTSEIDKARKMAQGNFLWFTHNGKPYIVDDPVVVAQIEAMYKPMESLGKQQQELGRQQAALGKQQEEMGRQQERASMPTPDISKEMADLNAAMVKLQSKMGKTVTRDELADLQGKLGELQGRLGALQGEMGARMGGFGAQQGRLGAEQGKLGAEQGRLGAEQAELASRADRMVKAIIDESLKNGKAKPVE